MQRMLWSSFCLLVLAITCGRTPAEGVRPTQSGKATVILDVTDGLGMDLNSTDVSVVSFESLDQRKDFALSFNHDHGLNWTARGIPFGHYRVTVHGEKFGTKARLVDIYDQFVSIEVPTRYATVSIEFKSDLENGGIPSTPGGKLVKDVAKINSFRSLDGTEFSSQFQSCQGSGIPYGIYQMEIADPLNGKIHSVVDVFKPEVWVLSGLLAYGEYPKYSSPKNIVSGVVSNIPDSERPVYVKMLGMYFNATIDDRVAGNSSSGSFSLSGFSADGTYLLLTIGRSGVLDVRQIVLPQNDPIEIDLTNRHQVLKLGTAGPSL